MNRIVASLVASVVAGTAYAQQAPVLQGNYSDNVVDAHNGYPAVVTKDAMFTHSILLESNGNGPVVPILPWCENYSGR